MVAFEAAPPKAADLLLDRLPTVGTNKHETDK
jgi:hypothetical protein